MPTESNDEFAARMRVRRGETAPRPSVKAKESDAVGLLVWLDDAGVFCAVRRETDISMLRLAYREAGGDHEPDEDLPRGEVRAMVEAVARVKKRIEDPRTGATYLRDQLDYYDDAANLAGYSTLLMMEARK